jgi:D-amino-acid dehydrogenase
MRSAIVLGAGMVGIATAVHLQRRGWSVVVVDRREPGQETSYGNAGFIQSEARRPYPMPTDLRSLLEIATGRNNDVHYRPATLPRHAGPLLRYWWNSFPARHDRISADYARIIAKAESEHDDLIRASGAGNLVRRDGYRILYRDQAPLDRDVAEAEALRAAYGISFRTMSAADFAKAEPGLIKPGVGALHWLEPWTISEPGALVAAYAHLFERLGGTIVRGNAETLTQAGKGWAVTSAAGRLEAEAVVVALGPWSPKFLRRFGYRIPMLEKRGYHRHYAGGQKLDLPLRDAAFGYVMAPMTKGLRLTTGAELSAPDAKPTPVQLIRAEAAARELIDLGKPVEVEPWLGTRPCMPDMLPLLGRAPRHDGLWLHFGHGHQGFTLGPTTGRMLAELMSGEQPIVEASAFRPDRF